MKTSELKVGMKIVVRTGCVKLNNVSMSAQELSGISGKKRITLSFKSGLVCTSGANITQWVIA